MPKPDMTQAARDYRRIEEAIHYLEEHFQEQPDLGQLARVAGLSEFHFQRVFQRWAGISPKRFLQFLSKEHAKEFLKRSNVLDASYEAGLSGPGRLHDLFVQCEAMTPGEYKEEGRGLVIDYGFHPTPFGECFIALTRRGICGLLFFESGEEEKVLSEFRRDWKNAVFNHDPRKSGELIKRIFGARARGRVVKIYCRGTNFQIKVWEALLRIPLGHVVSYQDVARAISSPKAMRAVGSAVGRNPVAYLIPCHRVIRGAGGLGGYRWGMARKKMMLAKETAGKRWPK